MKNYYTYAYLREDGTPYYIGKGFGIRVYKSHKHISVPKDKDKILFLKQNLTEEEAFKHEKYMISILGRKDLGTGILRNLTDGGDGSSGAIRSEETRKKISKSVSGENHPFYGKKHSQDTKLKICEALSGENNPNYGKILSEEHRLKISEANSGKVRSDETKRKMSESQKCEKNNFYGKTHTEETKKKISEAKRGKPHSEETKMKISESLRKKIG